MKHMHFKFIIDYVRSSFLSGSPFRRNFMECHHDSSIPCSLNELLDRIEHMEKYATDTTEGSTLKRAYKINRFLNNLKIFCLDNSNLHYIGSILQERTIKSIILYDSKVMSFSLIDLEKIFSGYLDKQDKATDEYVYPVELVVSDDKILVPNYLGDRVGVLDLCVKFGIDASVRETHLALLKLVVTKMWSTKYGGRDVPTIFSDTFTEKEIVTICAQKKKEDEDAVFVTDKKTKKKNRILENLEE